MDTIGCNESVNIKANYKFRFHIKVNRCNKSNSGGLLFLTKMTDLKSSTG